MIIHERTKTSREVREIETELANKLKRLAGLIRKDSFFPSNITGLQQKYGREVQLTIQAAVQAAYIAGVEYVSDFEDIPSLLTDKDLQNIREQTRLEVEGFWRTITRDMTNQQAPLLIRAVNIPAATSLIATATAVGSLALATVDKPKQLGAETEEVIWITALDERVCKVCRPLHGRVWKLNDSNLKIPIRDTHPNCRCRLLFRDGRQVFSH